MKPNINDVSKLQDLKQQLAEKSVTSPAINIIEQALIKGMTFRSPDDLAILNIPPQDLGVVGGFVDFGPTVVVEKNIKTVAYRFNPVGEAAFFFGYQFVVTTLNKDGFPIEQSFPIEDANLVIVDYDLNDLLPESLVTLRVNTAQGQHAKLRLSASTDAFTDEVIDVSISALESQTIDVEVEKLEHGANPSVTATYPIKGKVLSNRTDAKMDGYQVVIFAATENLPDTTTPDFSPVAFARTETNGYFVTSPLLFENNADIERVTAASALVTKDAFSAELPVRLIVTGGDAITLRTSRLPDQLILMLNEMVAPVSDGVLATDCGCTDLNFHDKKVLEEYSYYTVVRTSEPAIIADVLEEEKDVDLQDIYGVPGVVPFSVFQKYHAIQSRQIKTTLPPAAFLPTL